METHKVATLSLSWLALTLNCISKFWKSSKFWDTFLLIFLQSLKPWVNVPSLFISFNTFFCTGILLSSVCPWSVYLLNSEYFVVFGLWARLHETRSELKPVWNIKPLRNVVLFTWQFTWRFHCGDFPSNSKALLHMCKWYLLINAKLINAKQMFRYWLFFKQ